MAIRQIPEQYFMRSRQEEKPLTQTQQPLYESYYIDSIVSNQILIIGIIAALALGISLSLLLRR